MKKLMVMATVIGLGLAAQASLSIDWSASEISGYNTDTLYSGDATLYVTVYDNFSRSYQGTLSASMKNGSINVQGASFDTYDYVDESCLQEVIAYYEMTDGAGNKFSSGQTGFSGPALWEDKCAGLNFSSNGSWTAPERDPDPVPEPTSGLLLLIGLAGIALKRKRNKA